MRPLHQQESKIPRKKGHWEQEEEESHNHPTDQPTEDPASCKSEEMSYKSSPTEEDCDEVHAAEVSQGTHTGGDGENGAAEAANGG